MHSSEFDLAEFQSIVMGNPRSLIISSDQTNIKHQNQASSLRKIISLYDQSRSGFIKLEKVHAALADKNPIIKEAALDLIIKTGNESSFEVLFNALEDEESLRRKKVITHTIEKLQNKLGTQNSEISFNTAPNPLVTVAS